MGLKVLTIIFRINRYIVECKYYGYTDYRYRQYELIDTQWNVNTTAGTAAGRSGRELIDTQWNVNFASNVFNSKVNFRINRYIVECK